MNTDLIKLVSGIVLFFVLVFFCYIVLKWMSKRASFGGKGTYLKVIDRIMISRDTQIAVFKAGERLFVVGVTKDGVSPIAEISEEELKPLEDEKGTGTLASFFAGGKYKDNAPADRDTESSFLKRFFHNFAILSGFAKPDKKFDIPVKNERADSINPDLGKTASAFKDILAKNQDGYGQNTPSGQPDEEREYEFKEKPNPNADYNPIQGPEKNGGSGHSSVIEGQAPDKRAAGSRVSMSNYSAAVEKMKHFREAGPADVTMMNTEPVVEKINEAIDRAELYSEKEASIENILDNVSKRKDRYKRDRN